MASWGMFMIITPFSGANVPCGVPLRVRWTVQVWDGDMDTIFANAKLSIRLYTQEGAQGAYISLATNLRFLDFEAYVSTASLVPGSNYKWLTLAYTMDGTTPDFSHPAWRKYDQVALVAPAAPDAPIITSPAPGATVYVNAPLNVSWQYSDRNDLEQAKRYIILSPDGETGIMPVSGYSSAKSATVPPGTISLPAGVRRQNYQLTVGVSNAFNSAIVYSDPVLIGFLATFPDKPVPTKPANNAISYPLGVLDVEFPYTAHGGYDLHQVVFEYYKSGEAVWGQSLIFDTDEPKIQIPANTFTEGVWYWRIKAINAYGEASEYSDPRTLTIISSAPLTPVLTGPAAGETVYNHVPTAYEWTYINNAGVDQGAAELQYRIDGGSWTTVSLTGDGRILYVDHDGAEGVISWRVRTQNELGEWSPWSSIASYTLVEPLPVANPAYPLTVYVDPDEDQEFSWTASSPISVAIVGYEIAWKAVSDDTWATATGGAATSHLVPAGTLPEGPMVWRVRVTDADGRVSEWSQETPFTTLDVAPLAPTPVAPVDVYISVSDALRFRWIHVSPLNTPQGGAEIEYRQGDGEWTELTVEGAAQSVTLPAFTLATGSYAWRVRTLNRDGVPGPWSIISYFSITGAAVTPVIHQAQANGARPSVSWSAEGQVVYEVQMLQNGRVIDRYIAAAESDAGYYETRAFAAPGAVTIRVRNQNQFGFWSDWAQATVMALGPGGAAPVLSAAPTSDALAIRLAVTADPDADVILYRDGVPVASGVEQLYLDYGAAGGVTHVYMARAVFADGTYADSTVVTATLELAYATIAPAGALDQILGVRINMDSPPEYGRQVDTDAEQIVVEGRELPITQYGEHRTAAYSVGAVLTREEVARLMALKFARTPVLYRDPFGRRDYCRLASIVDYGALRLFGGARVSVSIALDAPL